MPHMAGPHGPPPGYVYGDAHGHGLVPAAAYHPHAHGIPQAPPGTPPQAAPAGGAILAHHSPGVVVAVAPQPGQPPRPHAIALGPHPHLIYHMQAAPQPYPSPDAAAPK